MPAASDEGYCHGERGGQAGPLRGSLSTSGRASWVWSTITKIEDDQEFSPPNQMQKETERVQVSGFHSLRVLLSGVNRRGPGNLVPYRDNHKAIIPEKCEAGEEQLIPAEQHATLEPKRGKNVTFALSSWMAACCSLSCRIASRSSSKETSESEGLLV